MSWYTYYSDKEKICRKQIEICIQQINHLKSIWGVSFKDVKNENGIKEIRDLNIIIENNYKIIKEQGELRKKWKKMQSHYMIG